MKKVDTSQTLWEQEQDSLKGRPFCMEQYRLMAKWLVTKPVHGSNCGKTATIFQ